MAALGSSCLVLSLAVCAYGIVAAIYGVRSGRVEFTDSARRSVYALAGILTIAFAVLELAFLRNDFSFNTVADTSSRTTPGFYRGAAVWASREGSLLLWAWLLSLWSSLALFLTRKRMRDIAAYATWLFLGIGILLGARWSYSVLGWGGYWGWDAVENASLMPWLTGTAFLHSLMIQEKRGMLKVWNVSLVLATGTLAIMGTFLVRSGILNSIHAFGGATLGVPFVTLIC